MSTNGRQCVQYCKWYGSSNLHSDENREMELETEDEINDDSEEENGDEIEETEGCVFESSIPMIGNPPEKTQLGTVLEWPSIDNNPVDEFKTIYIALAFPCLFPNGKADMNSPRDYPVKPLNYFRHLMNYKDGRFAQHPRFRYFALNSLMIWPALTEGNMFIKRHTEFTDMAVPELKEQIRRDPNILKKMMLHSSNSRGTRGYWYARGKELLAMVEQLRLPTLFFTLSAADFHWPDLYKVLVLDEDPLTISEARRRKLIAENPQIVDTFFF
ncbi:Protein pelota-like protein [Frankliniella fusca]|uniref:Protein pelota-like protein n=1 Tax=Frankliniella fusca TaxID=407009 RepID=A0AAE1GVJ9_9NEOP|nr:Protein pelota-like protein [Frankliniella fusca]